MWLKVLRFLGVQPLLPGWRSFQNQTDMCAGTLKNNTFILCLLSCRGRFVFRNLHVANFYQFYVKHVCCDLLISKNPNWKLMKRETSMRVVQQIGQVTTFKRVHEFNEKPTLLLGDPNVTLKTMRPRHTAPEVVRSSGIDVHTCGRFFCRGYIIASVSVGRFIYIYTVCSFLYTMFSCTGYMLICEGDCTSPLIGDDEIVSGIVYYHVLRHHKYDVFALNSLPVNSTPPNPTYLEDHPT